MLSVVVVVVSGCYSVYGKLKKHDLLGLTEDLLYSFCSNTFPLGSTEWKMFLVLVITVVNAFVTVAVYCSVLVPNHFDFLAVWY